MFIGILVNTTLLISWIFSGGSGNTQRCPMMLFDSISDGIKSAVASRSVAGQPAGKSLTEVVDCFLSLCKWKHRGQNEAGCETSSVLSPVYRTAYSCCICLYVFLYVFVFSCMHKKRVKSQTDICILSAPWCFTLNMCRRIKKQSVLKWVQSFNSLSD